MKPMQITYDICQHYLSDLTDVVSPALVAKVDGFRRSRNIAGLATCSSLFDSALHSVEDFRFLRQTEAFFKKNALFVQPSLCAEAARLSFHASEEQCSKTNRRLFNYIDRVYLIDQPFRTYVERMIRYISNVLGDRSSFLSELPRLVRVTPGATSHTARKNSLPQLKMRLKLFSSRSASKYMKAIYHYYGFDSLRIRTCHSNRVELVPKNWKTDRTIACEPDGSLPLQLAFDSYAKRRLRLFGIDLSDQSANARRAKHASIHDDYVTVDFRCASDTISYNTVALLFEEPWFTYLRDVRSPAYRGVFGDGVYAKFSSMGNGSTFCIETLIFAAACYAVSNSRDFLVYGDDVIIRKEFFDQFVQLTSFLGFSINLEKTFASGPFRESCGGDFFNGIDVTPVYIRNIDKRKANLCHLVNTIRTLCTPGGNLEKYMRDLIRSHKLPEVPFNGSTMSGVWIDPDIARTKKILTQKRKIHFGVDMFRSYVAKRRQRNFVDSRGYYLWFLNKNSQVFFSGPWEEARNVSSREVRTSSAPIFDHAYVRKWVCWKPAGGMPDYLYWWSERG